MSLPAHLLAIFEARTAPPRFPTPASLARAVNPKTVDTPALSLIDQALLDLGPDGRLIVTMPPQEGKSVRVAGDFPTWLLFHNPDLRIVVASYSQELAVVNGRAIRRRITDHDLGIRLSPDGGMVQDWHLQDHQGGVISVGIGTGLTGRPCDLLIIDDPIKDRQEADSPAYRQRVWDWWTDVASARLAPGAPVVLIQTRWHEDDLAGRLIAAGGWRVLNIPAEAESDDDPLGRQPGEFMVSARGRSTDQWELRKAAAGARTWAALYQGHPAPAGGGLIPTGRFGRYTSRPWVDNPDGTCTVPGGQGHVLLSWDMTFKDTKSSDFVVGQVWLERGADALLLEQVRGRWDFPESQKRFERQAARWPQASVKLVEDKANGTAIIASLKSKIPGLVPVTPHESKPARASAVSPFIESSNVLLPDPALAPWIDGFLTECEQFPNGAHDDQVDAMSQALQRIYLSAGHGQAWLDYMKNEIANRGGS